MLLVLPLIVSLLAGDPRPADGPRVLVERPALPCIAGGLRNPVGRGVLVLDRAATLRAVELDLTGTTVLGAVTAVTVEVGGARTSAPVDAERVRVPVGRTLAPGEHALEVTLDLRSGADLEGRVRVDPAVLEFADGTRLEPERPPGRQRVGLALRDGGDDGADVYRIPALATSAAGTLVAAFDVRWRGWGDLPGDIDVGVRRSTDGGRSWGPMRIALDLGDDPAHRFDGVGDPALLVDRETGRIWLAALWSHGDNGWHGSGPGLEPDETGQLVVCWSDDDGRSWSEPRNLTPEVKDPAHALLLAGPGRGIQLADGTLVFAAQYRDAPERGRRPYATVLVSEDHGATWRLGAGAKVDTTEAQVVELEDGRLMLNMRDDRGGSRSVATSDDLGRSWEEHPTSRAALVEPVCNAGLLRVGRTLLFTNPAVDAPPRRNMTLRASYDLGGTWPDEARILLDEGQSAGYSSLTPIDSDTVGVLFEGSRAQLTFVRVPLADLPARVR